MRISDWSSDVCSSDLTVPPPFALSLSGFFLPMAALSQFAARFGAARAPRSTAGIRMPTIQRSALVEHSAARMFALVNDIAAYPRRFDWCEYAHVLAAADPKPEPHTSELQTLLRSSSAASCLTK